MPTVSEGPVKDVDVERDTADRAGKSQASVALHIEQVFYHTRTSIGTPAWSRHACVHIVGQGVQFAFNLVIALIARFTFCLDLHVERHHGPLERGSDLVWEILESETAFSSAPRMISCAEVAKLRKMSVLKGGYWKMNAAGLRG